MNICLENLNKAYSGEEVLTNLSLNVEEGQNFCLLGKNGAGKTTLINSIIDLIKPDSGSVSIGGKSMANQAKSIKAQLGIMSEDNPLIEQLSGYAYLRFVGALYGVPNSELEQRIESLTNFFFEDQDVLRKKIAGFSTGMKKKIALIGAVMHKPSLLILDEPFSGLDPIAAKTLIDFLRNYQNGKRVIFLSSHDLSYVEKVATHIGVLNAGSIVYQNSLSEFTANGKEEIDDALLKLLQPSSASFDDVSWLNN